ncbi:uncharacterized protein LOC124911821 [Impatiens glandulifera]|uniref:uncharacterized protein LOC124911821 n=1 Tax=Impatiens glandulifera TaxID=253017 RepID=UPI001FB0A365|nr:uncharacterized protein LOC124911821 [Impatiens glandulifera]
MDFLSLSFPSTAEFKIPSHTFQGWKSVSGYSGKRSAKSNYPCVFAYKKSVKKFRMKKQTPTSDENASSALNTTGSVNEYSDGQEDKPRLVLEDEEIMNKDSIPIQIPIPSRNVVLKACITTSGAIATLGFIFRQISHVASVEGWPVFDSSTEVSFNFEMWHLELITGLVILVSSCRYILLKTWPDFAESSEAANRQILTSLDPLDYAVVAFLPGLSEELLFRGALLPLFGTSLGSVSAVALLFGVLHLGSGRKYSFALWATFVGLAYGYATIISSSVIVPMASHAINNMIGALMWRYTSATSK